MVIASATRQTTEEGFLQNTWLGKSLRRLPEFHDFTLRLALNRSDGLPKFYNEVIAAHPEEDIITMHDDLMLADSWFVPKLKEALSEFSVVGLCGCLTPKDEAHIAWHSAKHSPSGQIGTAIRDSHESAMQCNIATFGVTPARAAEMDGVMIAFNPKNISGLRFDERFMYHHYDVDFTLAADKGGLKVGTWPIFTIHVSNSGDGYHSRSFRESSEMFCAKWEAVKQ